MSDQGEDKPVRLTKDVRKQVLAKNEGYTTRTNYEGNNFREERRYEIKDGQVQVRSIGKTSWADSRFDTTSILDEAQEHRFLRNNLGALDTSGIERSAPRPRRAADTKPSESTTNTPLAPADHDDDGYRDDEGDEPVSGGSIIGAAALLAGIFVARAVAPHVKRLWTEHATPRIAEAGTSSVAAPTRHLLSWHGRALHPRDARWPVRRLRTAARRRPSSRSDIAGRASVPPLLGLLGSTRRAGQGTEVRA